MHVKYLCLSVVLFLIGIVPAFGQIGASGSITAAPDGPNFLYTISLHNSGTTNIDTFWFAWLPNDYDFLPSLPTSIVAPSNWTSYVESGFYGNSIEFYDTANSPILPGQTNNSFQFVSPDTPTALGKNGGLGVPITYSYVYSNTAPAGDDPTGSSIDIFSMTITPVPEPASMVLASIGGLAGLMIWRRRRVAAA
jgi:PEP-CTERM motif